MADQNVHIYELFSSRVIVIMRKDHPLSEREYITREDLAPLTNITLTEDGGPCSSEAYRQILQRGGITCQRFIRTNSLESEFLMAEAGIGVCFGPYFLRSELPPKLTAVPLAPELSPIEKYVCMIPKGNKNPAAHIFVEGIRTSKTMQSKLAEME